MARRKRRTIKKTSVKSKESINNSSNDFSYNPVEPEIIEPKTKSFGRMYKDAGAGVVKYSKVIAVRNNDNDSFLRIKSGKIGESIKLNETHYDNFEDACEAAKKMVEEKKVRGYKLK
jgi:predicted DNA-binding WGR domain protein